MTPPSTLSAQPNPSLGPPLTAGHLLKPLDFTSTQTIFLFPPMSSKLKGSSTRDPGPVDDAFYVAPTASRFWSAFNHAGTRLFVNVLRKLSANVQVPATVASNAMNVGIRATVRIPFVPLRLTHRLHSSEIPLRSTGQQRPARRHLGPRRSCSPTLRPGPRRPF